MTKGDADRRVGEIGTLPDAPLAMPKQRLEPAQTAMVRLLARLAGRPQLPSGGAPGTGR